MKFNVVYGVCSFSAVIPSGSNGVILEEKKLNTGEKNPDVGTSLRYEKIEIWTEMKLRKVWEFNEDGTAKLFKLHSCGLELPINAVEVSSEFMSEDEIKLRVSLNAKPGDKLYHWYTLEPDWHHEIEEEPRKTNIVHECWSNYNMTEIKTIITKNGKKVFEQSDWFKK